MPIHTCEHFDWLINNNEDISYALERAWDNDLNSARTPVTRDELVSEPLPSSPNQLQVPGPHVKDWGRERVDTTPETDGVAQFAPLGAGVAPVPFDNAMLLLAYHQANYLLMQSLAATFNTGKAVPVVPVPPPVATVTSTPAVAAVTTVPAVGSSMAVPMMLGDREVHIPRDRVLYTQGSHAYFQAATNNGKGIGRSICRHWLQKRCTYGDKCSFVHVSHLDSVQQQIFDEFVQKNPQRSPKK